MVENLVARDHSAAGVEQQQEHLHDPRLEMDFALGTADDSARRAYQQLSRLEIRSSGQIGHFQHAWAQPPSRQIIRSSANPRQIIIAQCLRPALCGPSTSGWEIKMNMSSNKRIRALPAVIAIAAMAAASAAAAKNWDDW